MSGLYVQRNRRKRPKLGIVLYIVFFILAVLGIREYIKNYINPTWSKNDSSETLIKGIAKDSTPENQRAKVEKEVTLNSTATPDLVMTLESSSLNNKVTPFKLFYSLAQTYSSQNMIASLQNSNISTLPSNDGVTETKFPTESNEIINNEPVKIIQTDKNNNDDETPSVDNNIRQKYNITAIKSKPVLNESRTKPTITKGNNKNSKVRPATYETKASEVENEQPSVVVTNDYSNNKDEGNDTKSQKVSLTTPKETPKSKSKNTTSKKPVKTDDSLIFNNEDLKKIEQYQKIYSSKSSPKTVSKEQPVNTTKSNYVRPVNTTSERGITLDEIVHGNNR